MFQRNYQNKQIYRALKIDNNIWSSTNAPIGVGDRSSAVQVLAGAKNFQDAYSRFPLLLSPSETAPLPPQALPCVCQSKSSPLRPDCQIETLNQAATQAEIYEVPDLENESGGTATDGHASIGENLAEAHWAKLKNIVKSIRCSNYTNALCLLSDRLWAFSSVPKRTSAGSVIADGSSAVTDLYWAAPAGKRFWER